MPLGEFEYIDYYLFDVYEDPFYISRENRS